MADEEPKHPYVTVKNAKVHLIFSCIIIFMSIIQLILGIVISEKIVIEVDWAENEDTDYIHAYFYGDSIWISFVGFILAMLGLSVWKTRSRSNGIMTSIMLFIAGFVIYLVSALLTGLVYYDHYTYSYYGDGNDDPYQDEIRAVRIGASIWTAITAIVIITYAFYSALHTCCNSRVRRERRVNFPAGTIPVQQPGIPQPQVVYVQAGGYPVQQPGYPVQQPGYPVQQPGYPGYPQQPVFIQQTGYPAASPPPQYIQQLPPSVQQVQIPHQVAHPTPLPGTTDTPDSTPPAYTD